MNSSSVRLQLSPRARWYDATAGRFSRLDPYFGTLNDPLSFNKYNYVHSNPINATDPTGLYSLGGALGGISISSIGRGLNQAGVYAGRQALMSGIETALEGTIGALLSATFGIENEFDVSRSFTTNFASNLVTAGLGKFRRLKMLADFAVRTAADVAHGESLGWALGTNLVILGSPALASMGTKILRKFSPNVKLPRGIFSGYPGGHEYIVKNLDLVMRLKDEWTDFYLKHKPPGAKVIFTDVSEGGFKANGKIDPVTGNIYIDREMAERYPHLMAGAILEELYHFKQFVRDGVLGTDVRRIPGYTDRIEAEAADVLRKNAGLERIS